MQPVSYRHIRPTWRQLRPTEASDIYTMGLDLGQLADHTALTILRRQEGTEPRQYDAVHVERFPLKVRYTTITDTVKAAIEQMMKVRPIPDVTLAVDYTGVGVAVLDIILRGDLGVPIVPISIHSGMNVVRDGSIYRVPKSDLVSTLEVFFQNGRLMLSAGSPHVAELRKELQSFRRKITKLGHATFGADERWREAPHDDLVLSAAIACWAAEHANTVTFAATPEELRGFFGNAGVGW